MAQQSELRDPWLVAAWPGIGHVGVGAVGFLVDQLQTSMVHELPAREFFDLRHIEVRKGIATPGRMPRSMFFEFHDPNERHDLLLFLGEAQPDRQGLKYCNNLLDYAGSRGVTRLMTFAAMATPMHPSQKPRVFAVATDQPTLSRLREHNAEVLDQGQVSGLNGVLLAAGLERQLPGACLMGEMPFFAGNIANPGAAMAVLEVFGQYTGLSLDFDVLREQSKQVEKALLQVLAQMQAAAQKAGEGEEEEGEFSAAEEEGGEDGSPQKPSAGGRPARPPLDPVARQRIESLFDEAEKDRTKAMRLKEELDRLGAFGEYEDRFLDLFRKGE